MGTCTPPRSAPTSIVFPSITRRTGTGLVSTAEPDAISRRHRSRRIGRVVTASHADRRDPFPLSIPALWSSPQASRRDQPEAHTDYPLARKASHADDTHHKRHAAILGKARY